MEKQKNQNRQNNTIQDRNSNYNLKMTLRYHPMHVRMAKTKNTDDTLWWKGCGLSGTLLHCRWKCTPVQLLWKFVWQFFGQLGINLP